MLLIHVPPARCCHSPLPSSPSFIPTSSEWVSAAHECRGSGGAELLHSVEEAEWRQQSSAGPWRLDVRGMLLSKLYHSVTQQDQSPPDCSPAPPLSSPSVSLCSITLAQTLFCFFVPHLLFFHLCFLSLPLLSFIRFHFFLYPAILPFSFQIIAPLCPSITNTGAETLKWGQWCAIKLSNLTPPSLLPHLPCHMCMHVHFRI